MAFPKRRKFQKRLSQDFTAGELRQQPRIQTEPWFLQRAKR
jgi:hypothetical protein